MRGLGVFVSLGSSGSYLLQGLVTGFGLSYGFRVLRMCMYFGSARSFRNFCSFGRRGFGFLGCI